MYETARLQYKLLSLLSLLSLLLLLPVEQPHLRRLEKLCASVAPTPADLAPRPRVTSPVPDNFFPQIDAYAIIATQALHVDNSRDLNGIMSME